MELARQFRLSPPGKGRGVSCDASGAFIDSIPLLKCKRENGKDIWQARNNAEISDALTKHFGLPIDIASKAQGLVAIARALNEGFVARAQLAALFLRFPEPPCLAKGSSSRDEQIRFIQGLYESDLLKARWNVRWPKYSPDSQGGRFAPRGAGESPAIGDNKGPLLEEAEAVVEEDAGVALAPLAALTAGALAASTAPAGGGEDEAVEELKIRENAYEQIHKHHPWPKYLGGAEDQELAELPSSLHNEFHNGVQRFAPHSRGKSFYDSLSPQQKEQIFRQLTDYAKQFDSDYGKDLYQRMLRNGFPVIKWLKIANAMQTLMRAI